MIPHHVYYQLAVLELLWYASCCTISGQAEARYHLSCRLRTLFTFLAAEEILTPLQLIPDPPPVAPARWEQEGYRGPNLS
jgi:hypothetical protein